MLCVSINLIEIVLLHKEQGRRYYWTTANERALNVELMTNILLAAPSIALFKHFKAGKGLYAGVLFMVLIVPYFLQSFYRNNTSALSSNLNPREIARHKEEEQYQGDGYWRL